MSLKISQLQNIANFGGAGNSDLLCISKYLGSNYFTSSNTTLAQISQFVSTYMGTQSGGILGASFRGTPLTYQVNFSKSYSDTSYIITIVGDDARVWSIPMKTTSSFVVSSNSNVPFNGYVYWTVRNLNY